MLIRFGGEAAAAVGCLLGDKLECLQVCCLCYISIVSVSGQGVPLERLVRLNAALGVNLKPNEDAE